MHYEPDSVFPFDDLLTAPPERAEPDVVRLCRGCLGTDKRLANVTMYTELLTELTQIKVHDEQEMPQWLCWECVALLQKSVIFRRKLHRSNALLVDYIARCAPFPMEAADQELSDLACPALCYTDVLITETRKAKNGFHQTLVHEKRYAPATTALPSSCPLAVKGEGEGAGSIKDEAELSDYEDNMTLGEFKELRGQADDDTLPGEEHPAEVGVTVKIEYDEHESSKDLKKKKKHKKKVEKLRKKSKRDKCKEPEEIPKAPRIRKAIEIDPHKIRTIHLDPAEQVRARAEAAYSGGYLRFPFKCSLCYKGFNYETKLQNHMKKHDPARGKFECKLCRMYLPTIYSFNIHTLTHTTRYECLQCGKQMTDRGCIAEHYESAHEGVTQQYTCHLCQKVSLNYRTHRGHMRNHHSGDRPKCDQCGKTFVNKDSLAEHILIHQGIKNHTCDKCGGRFRTKTQLKHHQLKHTTAREFYCVECDVRFKSAHNLRQHLGKSQRHIDADSLKFPCTRCPRRFDSERSLEHHVAFGHEGRRLHVCGECGAQLATRNSLAKHTRVAHQGYKPPLKHVCDTCGKAFRGKNVLVNHVRTHTGEKPYECTECGRKFSQRTAMRTHIKLVHLKIKRNAKIKDISVPIPIIKIADTVPKEETLVFEGWDRTQLQQTDVYYISGT